MKETKKPNSRSDIEELKRILVKYGFTKINTTDWLDPDQICYEHKEKGWFANILDRGAWANCWMTGKGLQSSNTFPGGYIYSARSLEDELNRVFN